MADSAREGRALGLGRNAENLAGLHFGGKFVIGGKGKIEEQRK